MRIIAVLVFLLPLLSSAHTFNDCGTFRLAGYFENNEKAILKAFYNLNSQIDIDIALGHAENLAKSSGYVIAKIQILNHCAFDCKANLIEFEEVISPLRYEALKLRPPELLQKFECAQKNGNHNQL
jgi:hypothetical protein